MAAPTKTTVRNFTGSGVVTSFPASGLSHDIWNDAVAQAIQTYADSRANWLTGFVNADQYDSIKAACDAIGSVNLTTLVISTTMSAATTAVAVTITSNISVFPVAPGVINKGLATSLTINGPVVGNPMHKWLSGFTAGTVTLACPVRPEWFAISGTGVEVVAGSAGPYVVDFNIVDAATAGGPDGDDGRRVVLTGGKHYRIATAPWTLTKTKEVTSDGGMGYIHNTDSTNDAMVTPEGLTPGSSYSDGLTLEDFYLLGPNTGSGRGISLRDATRWRISNVVSNNHGSHGLHIDGSCWIGSVMGGHYRGNNGNGIYITAKSAPDAGSPNGVNLLGVECEGNEGWGIRIGDVTNPIPGIVSIFGGVVETNTLGGIKADNVNELKLSGLHFEDSPTLNIGVDANVAQLSIEDCWGLHNMIIGSSVKALRISGGHASTSGLMLDINSRGNLSIKDFKAQGSSPGVTTYFRETCPNAPTYYASCNIGHKGMGNLVGTGNFLSRSAGITAAPDNWVATNATIAYDTISDLSSLGCGKVVVVTATADAGNIRQDNIAIPRNYDGVLYLSAWIRVISGTGVIEVTDGTYTNSVETTTANWHRITIPCAPMVDVSTMSVRLKGKLNGAVVRFAEVQLVGNMDFSGWRSSSQQEAYELSTQFTWNPNSITNVPSAGVANSETTTVTVTDATVGHEVIVLPPYDLLGLTCTAYVSAANTVIVVLINNTAGAVNLANSTDWFVKVRQFR